MGHGAEVLLEAPDLGFFVEMLSLRHKQVSVQPLELKVSDRSIQYTLDDSGSQTMPITGRVDGAH